MEEDQWQAFLTFTEQTFHYLSFQKYIHTPTWVIVTTEKTSIKKKHVNLNFIF